MSGSNNVVEVGSVVLVIWFLLWILSNAAYPRLLSPQVTAAWPAWRRFWLSVASFLVGAGFIGYRILELARRPRVPETFWRAENRALKPLADVTEIGLHLLCRGLVVVLVIVLAVKLYEKWLRGRLSEEERAPGAVGVRAWLSPSNILLAGGIALCAWNGFDYSFWFVLILAALAVLGYPLLLALQVPPPPVALPADTISPERQRVMRLLEQGKITAEESSELLSALAATVPPPPPAPQVEPWTPSRKLMAAGAALVLLGFFLPWFKIDPARELGRATEAMQQQMREMSGGGMMPPMPNPGAFAISGGTISIAGGDIPNGLGWIAALLGVGAACMPYVATGMRRDTRWTAMLIALAAGLVIVLYLLTSNPRAVSVGLPIVLVGYVLELLAVLGERERRSAIVLQAAPAL